MKKIVFMVLVSGLGIMYAHPFKKFPLSARLAQVGWQQRTMSHMRIVCKKPDYCPVAVQNYLNACAYLDKHILWARAEELMLENRLRLLKMEIATAQKIRNVMSVDNFTSK